MSLHADSALEALALIIDAVRDSPDLQSRFQELARLSGSDRREAIAKTVREMRAHRESAELITAFDLLAHPQLFGAVVSALRDCGVRV